MCKLLFLILVIAAAIVPALVAWVTTYWGWKPGAGNLGIGFTNSTQIACSILEQRGT